MAIGKASTHKAVQRNRKPKAPPQKLAEPYGWDGQVPTWLWQDAEQRLAMMEDWTAYAVATGRGVAIMPRHTVSLSELGLVDATSIVGEIVKPEQGILEAKRVRAP